MKNIEKYRKDPSNTSVGSPLAWLQPNKISNLRARTWSKERSWGRREDGGNPDQGCRGWTLEGQGNGRMALTQGKASSKLLAEH